MITTKENPPEVNGQPEGLNRTQDHSQSHDRQSQGQFSKEFVETVKERTDIVEIVQSYVTLDKKYKGKCPFHPDENPSFSVNPKGQYFYCFGCGVGGDVIKFLELIENKSFREALKDLASRAGISFPSRPPEELAGIKESRTIEEILTETATFYHQSLTPEARSYLTQRAGLYRGDHLPLSDRLCKWRLAGASNR
jgi:DNA primase